MDIQIYDRTLRLCGICDTARTVRLREEFADAGSFSMRVPADWADRFPIDGILRFPGAQEAYTVRSVHEDSAAGTAVIAGSGVLSFLGRRILTEPFTGSGAAEEMLCSLCETWGADAVPGTLIAERAGIETEVNAAAGHVDLLSALRDICTAAGLGMELTFAPETGVFRFAARARREVPLFLSRSAGNLAGVVRLRDYSRYRNRVIVRGSGGHTVTVDAAGLFGDGVDDAAEALREEYSDETDLAMDRYDTEEAYREALAARGRRILAECRPRLSLTVQVPEATARLLTPGDICFVSDTQTGVHTRALCTARTHTYEAGKTGCAVTVQTL